MRHLYWNNGFKPAGEEIEDHVKTSGIAGITSEELKKRGCSGRRLADSSQKLIIFNNNRRWIHHVLAASFPHNHDAQAAVKKFPG